MSASKEALISAFTVMSASRLEQDSKNIVAIVICHWCEKREAHPYRALVVDQNYSHYLSLHYLCQSCSITAVQALELARQVTQEIKKGGKQLYIAVERTGQDRELLSVRRWSPLEPLESAESVSNSSTTFQ